jgi:hypothetical protein
MFRVSLHRLRPHLMPWLLLVIVGAALCGHGWRRWGDPVIDHGRELYVPWQLAEGQQLYCDVAYPFGPLAPVVSALLFKGFGADSAVWVAGNLVIVLVIAMVIYCVALQFGHRGFAGGIVLIFLTLFAFSHLQIVDNYNFVTPYAQPVTLGLVLLLMGTAALARSLRTHPLRGTIAGHALLGITVLTKPEIALAAVAVVVVFWISTRRLHASDWPTFVRRCACGIGSSMAAFVVVRGLLLPMAPWLEPPPWVFPSGPAGVEFYGQISGLTRWRTNFAQIGAIGLAQIIVAIGAIGVLRVVPQRARLSGAAILSCVLCVGVLWIDRAVMLHVFRAVPLWIAVAWLWMAVQSWTDPLNARLAVIFIWITMAIALLPKIILRVQLDHYGFALAMPSILLLWGWLLSEMPLRLERQLQLRKPWLCGALGITMAIILWHTATSIQLLSSRTAPLGDGPRMWMHDDIRGRAGVLQQVLVHLESSLQPTDRLAVLPEGSYLNVLTGHPSSIPYIAMTPFDLELWPQSTILEALTRDPPEVIVIQARSTAEMGAAFFGPDYGHVIHNWIIENYSREASFGSWPQSPAEYGAIVLRRTGS